ncbi:uncharacterized protein LOC132017444 [Mustela nigripes]|uniref:uncharacterized protein LOC132017444 n=1 Tax=Mustela nigripes TaxID=77151 RepID=UPI002816442F|nr:uncharacterized protein LOC132017444 [Mustela nigripes]
MCVRTLSPGGVFHRGWQRAASFHGRSSGWTPACLLPRVGSLSLQAFLLTVSSVPCWPSTEALEAVPPAPASPTQAPLPSGVAPCLGQTSCGGKVPPQPSVGAQRNSGLGYGGILAWLPYQAVGSGRRGAWQWGRGRPPSLSCMSVIAGKPSGETGMWTGFQFSPCGGGSRGRLVCRQHSRDERAGRHSGSQGTAGKEEIQELAPGGRHSWRPLNLLLLLYLWLDHFPETVWGHF